MNNEKYVQFDSNSLKIPVLVYVNSEKYIECSNSFVIHNSEKYLFCGDSSLKMSVLGDINSEKVCMVWL